MFCKPLSLHFNQSPALGVMSRSWKLVCKRDEALIMDC